MITEIAIVDVDIVSDLGDAVGDMEVIKMGGLLDGGEVKSNHSRRFDLGAILEDHAKGIIGLLTKLSV